MKQEKWIRLGQWLFRNRSFTPLPLLIFCLWAFKPVWYQNWLLILGGVLSLAGEGVRVLAVGWSYGGTSGREAYLRADSLNTEGIYSLVRNPLYIGNIAIFLGLTLVYGNPWVSLIMTLFLVVQYGFIVSAEEGYLKEKYGDDYRDYCRNVSRFIPKSWRFKVPSHPFSWLKVLLKENDSVFNMGIVMMGIIQYRIYRVSGSMGSRISIWLPVIAWIVLYASIKIYKRSKRSF